VPTEAKSTKLSFGERKALEAIAKKTGQTESAILRHAFTKYVMNDMYNVIREESQLVAEDKLNEFRLRSSRLMKTINACGMWRGHNLETALENINNSGLTKEERRQLKASAMKFNLIAKGINEKANKYLDNYMPKRKPRRER
jgi:hypothetical protein